MAYSKLRVPSLGTFQHFLECDIKDCERNCQFYCNPCHQQMCDQCRDEHLKNPEYKDHEVVLYQQRKRQLPMVKCKIHPTKDIDMLCVDCQLPLCSKCSTQGDHRRHELVDLETIYEEKMAICLEEIFKIDGYFLPTSHDLHKEIKADTTEIQMIMDNLRATLKADGETLKSMVDTVVSENIHQVDKIEHSFLEQLHGQNTTFDDYMGYLRNHIKELHEYLSSTNLTTIVPKLSKKFPKILPIPETTKLIIPIYTNGVYSKDDVAKLLGKINVKNLKAESRKIKPIEIVAPLFMKSASQQMTQDTHKNSDAQPKKTVIVTAVGHFPAPGVGNVFHISLDQSGRLWISDDDDNLVQTDKQGNQIQMVDVNGLNTGFHTVTKDGDLIFIDSYIDKKVIKQLTFDKGIKRIYTTRYWEPISIHSSHINGDILVGMMNDTEVQVTRFSKTGEELQTIEKDHNGQKLYSDPHYITENINGDICVSDLNNQALVVVNKSGQHRFSYTGHELDELMFTPWGICTDALGHILVCDVYNGYIHLLDQDGQLLFQILTNSMDSQPHSLCVDNENNLYVGQEDYPRVTVFKYLQ